MAVALAIAIASAVLGADLRLEAGVRTEGRSRTIDGPEVARTTVAEVSLLPRAALALASADLDVRAQYAPALRAPDVRTSTTPDVLHAAELRARLRALPAWTIAGTVAAERGTTDLLAEARRTAAAPPTVVTAGALPTTALLRYAAARGDLMVEGTFDPRTSATVTAGWFAGGGDGAASRALLPFERGFRGAAGIDWNASRRDVVSARASAIAARFTGEQGEVLGETGLASLAGSWRRRLARETEARAGAGALAYRNDAPERPSRRAIFPAGELGLSHAFDRLRASADVAFRLGAAIDRLRGSVDRQLEAEAAARWSPNAAWSFDARAVAGLVRQEAGDLRRGMVDLRVERRSTRWLSVGLGVYGQAQRTPDPVPPDPPMPSFGEAGAFGFLALHWGT